MSNARLPLYSWTLVAALLSCDCMVMYPQHRPPDSYKKDAAQRHYVFPTGKVYASSVF